MLRNSHLYDIESFGVIGNMANFSEFTQSEDHMPGNDSNFIDIMKDLNLKYELKSEVDI